ncbi:flagellin [Deferribacterales bacterium Es71-Z0220]|uniref:flagellin N-terminal helical domain-containing protein n=1 Tax=Deferrivibrio essentukiensis TaxID=2880922 RepID=UPI001F61B8DD|nr:flagellin [Deferrivibrio essentukiensis]MCB4204793.1 flagellin [Deferrivibrio essentukiensis]
MALTIYNNISSLTSQRYLGQTNSATAKTLEKLSSGLRINHASDDASGLAISEKLRGQISGLKRASMNAQDGISMLQTGEGALQEVQNIIQRMRELAVQAANGTYTSNDRKEIQKEVDQLKDEINRISSSTEFNTKKLLNGDATALWSSSSNKIDALVKSSVAEGNYKLSIAANPGTNYVYKTDIMTLKDGAYAAEIIDNDVSARSIKNVSGLNSTINDSSKSYKLTFSNADLSTTDVGSAVGTYLVDSTVNGASSLNLTSVTITATGTSGYLEIEMAQGWTAGGANISDVGKARFINAITGDVTEWTSVSYSGGSHSIVINNIDGSIDITLSAADSLKFSEGDKKLFWVTDGSTDATAAANSYVTFTDSYGKTAEFELANIVSSSEYKQNTLYTAEINTANGSVNLGSFTFEMGKLSAALAGDLKFDVAGPGDRATTSTKLSDIARFVTADGRNIFDNTQELTIFGNGKQTTIFLEGSDTVADFEQKLTDALVNELGVGSDTSTVNNHLVDYVKSVSNSNSNQAVAGTFVIQTALLGDDSKLSFIGDQALIDGLSLATIQEGENSELTISVTNAHTGEEIGSDTVNDYTLKGVISGVDVKVDSSLGVDVADSNDDGKLEFSAASNTNVFLHVVDNSTDLQIGANEGQAINVSIAQIDTKSLGLEDVLMVDQSSAQKAITKLDKALEFVSSTRATIGAQINRLESAISNLDTARENLTASESRIRDLDMAEEMAKFTRNQILSQAGTAMLAQANQLPQMALQLLQ